MTDDSLHMLKSSPFDALRRIASRSAKQEEHCDLCGEAIGPEHRHLLNVSVRQVLCACRACTLLFDRPTAGAGARRLIPTRILLLPDFEMTEAQWDSLQIPVNMAFFCTSSEAKQVLAFYPSPMGPTEAQLPFAALEDLAQSNPILRDMETDVEALLVARRQDGGDYFLVPIDECYRLVGLIRLYWKGLSGGNRVREEIDQFFGRLKERAIPAGASHA